MPSIWSARGRGSSGIGPRVSGQRDVPTPQLPAPAPPERQEHRQEGLRVLQGRGRAGIGSCAVAVRPRPAPRRPFDVRQVVPQRQREPGVPRREDPAAFRIDSHRGYFLSVLPPVAPRILDSAPQRRVLALLRDAPRRARAQGIQVDVHHARVERLETPQGTGAVEPSFPEPASAVVLPVGPSRDSLVQALHEPRQVSEAPAQHGDPLRIPHQRLDPRLQLPGPARRIGHQPAPRHLLVRIPQRVLRTILESHVVVVRHDRVAVHPYGEGTGQFKQALLDPALPVRMVAAGERVEAAQPGAAHAARDYVVEPAVLAVDQLIPSDSHGHHSARRKKHNNGKSLRFLWDIGPFVVRIHKFERDSGCILDLAPGGDLVRVARPIQGVCPNPIKGVCPNATIDQGCVSQCNHRHVQFGCPSLAGLGYAMSVSYSRLVLILFI